MVWKARQSFKAEQALLCHYSQYLNCSGDVSPHRDLSAGLWEEKVTIFGRKNCRNFRFWPEEAFQFRRRPFFFGDHLFLAGKTAQIFQSGQKMPLHFGEDLFFLEIT